MEAPAGNVDPCAICLDDMGAGQAIFKAECSHAFHLRCISDSVASGNRTCPLCKAKWRHLPAVDRAVPAPQPRKQPPRVYADDDPVAQTVVAPAQGQAQEAAADVVGAMVLKTHCERPAVPRAESRDGFAVLVHATAPGVQAGAAGEPRAPLDLVTVLDVSSSMLGAKLRLLKQAMGFVIDNLGPADRLSVVSFCDEARREIRLTRMSEEGKAAAKRAVQSLFADGCTDIRNGLDVAAQVLADRRHRNAVTSIILLSDGQDTCGNRGVNGLMPPALRSGDDGLASAVHTFGFGTDHDAEAMHAIAEATRGTFSYIVRHEVVQDSFAQCIGGLLTVVAQRVRLDVACEHPGVRVREVKSGLYENRVDADGRAASVEVGDLYADEVRRFLILVDVPAAEEDVTRLVSVRCTYRDAATGQDAAVAGEDAVVRRPVEALDGDDEVSVEVERERLRLAAAEDMEAARAAAEDGRHSEAFRLLSAGRMRIGRQRSTWGDDIGVEVEEACMELEDEMDEMQDFVATEERYQEGGRVGLLSSTLAHRLQRASYAGIGASNRTLQTYSARIMLEKSKRARGQPEESSSAPTQATKKNKSRKHRLKSSK